MRCPLRPFLLAEDVSTASFFDVLEPGQAGIKAANRPNGEAEPAGSPFEPFSQWPPGRGRRYVYIWHCCACGKAGIGIMTESCPDCGASRCPFCRTEKVRVQSTMRPESLGVDKDVDNENTLTTVSSITEKGAHREQARQEVVDSWPHCCLHWRDAG